MWIETGTAVNVPRAPCLRSAIPARTLVVIPVRVCGYKPDKAWKRVVRGIMFTQLSSKIPCIGNKSTSGLWLASRSVPSTTKAAAFWLRAEATGDMTIHQAEALCHFRPVCTWRMFQMCTRSWTQKINKRGEVMARP